MKFTPKRGLFRLVIAIAVIPLSLLFAKSFPCLVIYALFAIVWLICWLIEGFFDKD